MVDLREFIKAADGIGQLKIVKGADWNLEIGALTELVSAQNGPALLFDEIKGHQRGFRVLANAFSTPARTALAWRMPVDLHPLDIINLWRKRLKQFKPVKPVEVQSGPVTENIDKGDKINLWKFPAPKWHEHDGGRYIGTGTAFIQQDPDTGFTNIGAYRAMIHDEKTLGIYISPGRHGSIIMKKFHEKGKPCPVAVVCGNEPALFAESAYNVPEDVSAFEWAGWLRGGPVEYVRGPTTGLPIPITSEIVIEGFIPPGDFRIEGPFGEWTGYYSEVQPEPIVNVTAVLYRNDPIILGTPPLRPPLKGEVFGVNFILVPNVWDQLEASGIPDVKGVWALDDSSSGMIIVVAIKQRYPGHAMQTAMVTGGCRGGGYMSRYIIVVDDDIDITNPQDVLWALATRSEPSESIDIVRNNWTSRLDPRIPEEEKRVGNTTHSKALILAVRPFYRKDKYPKVNKISDKLAEEITAKYSELLIQTKTQASQPRQYKRAGEEILMRAAPPVPM